MFILLETLYRNFDRIAQKRGVYKVRVPKMSLFQYFFVWKDKSLNGFAVVVALMVIYRSKQLVIVMWQWQDYPSRERITVPSLPDSRVTF